MARTIIFVCTGNTCRSPLAEAGMRKMAAQEGLDWVARSAGLAAFGGLPASDHAIAAALEAGLDLADHVSRPLTREDALEASRIVTMTQKHKEAIVKKMPALEDKVLMLSELAGEGVGDVEDPVGGDLPAYREARDRILDYLRKALPRLKEGD